MSMRFAGCCLAAGVVLLLGACPGCGTGEYEARLKAQSRLLGKGSVFSEMHPATILPGTSLSVRIPNCFDQTPLTEPTDPRRIKPPLGDQCSFVTDLKLTHEGFFEYDGGDKGAFYCYLAVIDVAKFRDKDPFNALRNEMQNAFSGASVGQWTAVECDTPEGQSLSWQKLRHSDQQEFYFEDTAGQTDFRESEATWEFYCRQEGNFLVAAIWRLPTSIEGNIGLAEWGPRLAGTLGEKRGHH